MRQQFTIRTLMIGTMIFACFCAGIVWNRQRTQLRIQRRQKAIAWLEDRTGPVSLYGSGLVYGVDVGRVHLDENAWAHLSLLRGTRSVWLDETNLTEADLDGLSNFQRLENLTLHYSNMTDADLPGLSRNARLEQLDLGGTGITSDGIKTISRLPSLVTLNIAKTQVGDEAIPALKKMKRLRSLNVYSTRISTDGLSQLRNAMPKCRIFPYPGSRVD